MEAKRILLVDDDSKDVELMLASLAEQNLADADPERWVEVLLHSHPAISRRVAMAEEFGG